MIFPKKWLAKISRKFSKKRSGMVILLPTIILSGLILVVSVGLSQVLMTELEFSADLLFAEKAYYAAESGIERSLLALKDQPLNLVKETEKKVGTSAEYDLNINNSVPSFPFKLAKNETIKFRLGVDTEDSFEVNLAPRNNFEIILNGDASLELKEKLQWKVLCKNNNDTVALYGYGDDFSQGTFDDGVSVQENKSLNTFLGSYNSSASLCFMSLKNISKGSQDVTKNGFSQVPNFAGSTIKGTFIVKNNDEIAPDQVEIVAVGRSVSREKKVKFNYRQKNLASVFDLGLYYFTEVDD